MDDISTSNQRLLHLVADRRKIFVDHPKVIFPWWRPCTVKALLVTDGALDFGLGDFGLSAFVNILINDGRSYVRFEITLAHLRTDVSNDQVMHDAPGIARSIKGFMFDDPNHFTPEMYDEVWLFGHESNFHNGAYPNRQKYPADRLGNAELLALTAHMNRGGGIFATGDHGAIGIALCGSVDRVRSMRYWDDFGPFDVGGGEVGMTSARRNDSNQIGNDPGSQFNDQSDDVPQRLDLKLYSTHAGFFREARYPHPVMCSRFGRIDVFPDHPHEGECREPKSLTEKCQDGSDEYPNVTVGSGRLSPELVAWGRVPAGNTAVPFNKVPTQAHRFGVVSAYNGHRCGVGRVVCDSTWHHFVNVNIIGVFNDAALPIGSDVSKRDGFLSSAAGRAALDKIKEYYVNVGVWIAPVGRHRCMNSRLWWDLTWSDRIVEATLMRPDQTLEKVSLHDLYHIGIHARDVLGRLAGACQTVHWILPWLQELYVELIPWVDPWGPWAPERTENDAPLPWFDTQPLIDVAIGGALVALREAQPYPPENLDELDGKVVEVAQRGAAESLKRGLDELTRDMSEVSRLTAAGREAINARLGEPS